MVLPARVVPQENGSAISDRDQHVHGTVVVEVPHGQAAAGDRPGKDRTALVAHILEAIASVAEQQHGFLILHALYHPGHIPFGVAVGENDVRVAVVVIIEELYAHAAEIEGVGGDPETRGDVAENAPSFLVIEREHLVIHGG